MSELDRLHEIIDSLPQQHVQALLILLETAAPLSPDQFAKVLEDASEEEVDEETAARVLAAETASGETISHSELKQRLGL